MNTWIISDTHFGHKNIIEYCNRPFKDTNEMDKEMIKRWNSAVRKGDIVWHLGDFGIGTKSYIKSIVSKLNGRIYLIKGNHDNHSDKWFYDCGFAKVYDRPVIVDDYFILSHHPRSVGANMYGYLYGHVHNDDIYKDFTSNSCCVCTERLNYTPILLDYAKKQMKLKQNP